MGCRMAAGDMWCYASLPYGISGFTESKLGGSFLNQGMLWRARKAF